MNKKSLNTINNESKYEPILDSIIAKKLKLKKNNIVFFKTEYDCVKKLIDIFVPKYQNIIVVNPLWNILKLVALENKINIDYSTLKKYDKSLTPDFNRILKLINTKTKMIYLSSPNIITGQNIEKDEFTNFLKEVPENIIVLLDQRYYDFVDLKTQIPKDAPTTLIPVKIAHFYQIIPLRKKEDSLHIAMNNPLDLNVLDEISYCLGEPITYSIAGRKDLRNALKKIYDPKNI